MIKTVNDLLEKVAKTAKELADMPMPQLRRMHPEIISDRGTEWRELTQGMTRGDLIELILLDDYLLEFDREIEEQ